MGLLKCMLLNQLFCLCSQSQSLPWTQHAHLFCLNSVQAVCISGLDVAELLKAASEFVRLLHMHFWFPAHATVFESLKVKSRVRTNNTEHSRIYVQCTAAVLAQCHVPLCCQSAADAMFVPELCSVYTSLHG